MWIDAVSWSVQHTLVSSSLSCFRWLMMSSSLQWIVGGVNGPPGAPAAVRVTLASDDAFGRAPVQCRRSVDGPVRENASDWTHAALHPVLVNT